MIMKSCDCFDTLLDLSLMNVTRFSYIYGVRPCDMVKIEGMLFIM